MGNSFSDYPLSTFCVPISNHSLSMGNSPTEPYDSFVFEFGLETVKDMGQNSEGSRLEPIHVQWDPMGHVYVVYSFDYLDIEFDITHRPRATGRIDVSLECQTQF